MSKYSSSAHRQPLPPKNRTPPLMRGIGCLMMVVVPVFSWVLGEGLVGKYAGIFPREWMGNVKISPLLNSFVVLRPIWNFIASQQALMAKFIVFLGIVTLLGVLLSVIYGYIYNMTGPSQYGPHDVPPPNVRTKKYKR
jgi:hypothetical protein